MKTKKRVVLPFRYLLTVGNFGVDKVAEADCIGSLDFAQVSACRCWAVHAVYTDPDGRGDCYFCIASVNQCGGSDRVGRIRKMVQLWLCRLEESGRLCGSITEFDGGSVCVDFPALHYCDE